MTGAANIIGIALALGGTMSPPPSYLDPPYPGSLYISVLSSERLQITCRAAPAEPTARYLACAFARDTFGIISSASTCHIYIVEPSSLPTASWLTALAHELAHCNGWPSDHPRNPKEPSS